MTLHVLANGIKPSERVKSVARFAVSGSSTGLRATIAARLKPVHYTTRVCLHWTSIRFTSMWVCMCVYVSVCVCCSCLQRCRSCRRSMVSRLQTTVDKLVASCDRILSPAARLFACQPPARMPVCPSARLSNVLCSFSFRAGTSFDRPLLLPL